MRALYWFTHDLRMADNPALAAAAAQATQLLVVYVVEPRWFRPNRYGVRDIGERRWRFVKQALQDLAANLAAHGQRLHVVRGDPVAEIARLVGECRIGALWRSYNPGVYERRQWQALQRQLPHVAIHEIETHSLFDRQQLPAQLSSYPKCFADFRAAVSAACTPISPNGNPGPLPPALPTKSAGAGMPAVGGDSALLSGGETAAQRRVLDFFNHGLLDNVASDDHFAVEAAGADFGPWLAAGNLSARRLWWRASTGGVGVSVDPLIENLLEREYWQWYAAAHGVRLFRLSGILGRAPLTSFYAERFQKWCAGATPEPLVNACMRQLNVTGYLSPRGRRLVAQCCVVDLQLDWRYCAAYCEQQSLDYDVACHWGRWQAVAGVGADVELEFSAIGPPPSAQGETERAFISAWSAEAPLGPIDSIDAADWPRE